MKLTVKTLRRTRFDILVQPTDTIMAVKKTIEEALGKDSFPWGQQLFIHNGKVLKDESPLEENEVSEDGFLVVMLSKMHAPEKVKKLLWLATKNKLHTGEILVKKGWNISSGCVLCSSNS